MKRIILLSLLMLIVAGCSKDVVGPTPVPYPTLPDSIFSPYTKWPGPDSL